MKIEDRIIRCYLACNGSKTLKEIAEELNTHQVIVSKAITAYFRTKKPRRNL